MRGASWRVMRTLLGVAIPAGPPASSNTKRGERGRGRERQREAHANRDRDGDCESTKPGKQA